MKTVGLIGLGAMGVLYSDLLHRALGCENFFVIADQERIAAISRRACIAMGSCVNFVIAARKMRCRWIC